MTNRFESKENRILGISDQVYRIFSVVIFIAIAVLFYLAVDASGRSPIVKQKEYL